MRKTTREFWDATWEGQGSAAALDPASPALVRQFERALDAALAQALALWGGRAATLMELGCGGSVYLPYLARRFGLDVTGLDYSAIGCNRARRILAASDFGAPLTSFGD